MYVPAPARAGLQLPPASGDPPNAANNCDAVTVVPEQMVRLPLVPALGWACVDMFIVLEVAVHEVLAASLTVTV